MSLLYCKEKTLANDSGFIGFEIAEFSPSLFKVYLEGEKHNFKTTFVRLYFQLMTFGKAKLFCALDEFGKVTHTSYVVPKCFKFSFLKKGDYIIGPCYTKAEHRGKGIYPQMLGYICSNVGSKSTVFYMSVDENNFPSVKGIEKAGFKNCGTVKKTRLFKRYKRD